MLRWMMVVVLCLASPLYAQTERVTEFASTVWVEADGSMRVVERIEVWATGEQIRRGIVREFPTTYVAPSGRRTRVGFEVVDVQRDGVREPYHTERLSNGVAVYVGDKNVLLSPGAHTYTLTYMTTRQVGFFQDHDELYWNVNGNGWRLPMDRVRCEVHLPEGASVLEAVTYEGPQGSTEGSRLSGQGRSIVLQSSRPYAPGEGLTIAVSWPKGFVRAPDAAEQAADWVADQGSMLAAGGGVVLLLAYYVLAWLKVGRDPAKSVVIPRFAPPQRFSPAMTRMLWKMKYDNAAFSSALVHMAVRGALSITDNGNTRLTISRPLPPGLSVGEQAVWRAMDKSGGTVVLKSENHATVGKVRQALKDALRKEVAGTYFSTNSKWMIPGLGITLAAVGGMALTATDAEGMVFLSVWLTGWTFGCLMLLRQIGTAWAARNVKGKVSAVVLSVFALPFLGGEVAGFVMLGTELGVFPTACLLAMMVGNALFYELLKAPTVAGRRVLDELEGFRLYLSVAEEARLNFIHPPEETPELFEKFLPYAMALGVEVEWGQRFERMLEASGYEPNWYHGRKWDATRPSSFASGLAGGLSAAVSSASTAPGSSSGMSGGSSGGGGGGGGGGGW